MSTTPALISPRDDSMPLRIGIVAGEISGDLLGADLIKALRKSSVRPIEFCGIGGARMLAEGFHSLFDIERLAVMGFVEPLKRLPELLAMRKSLREYFLNWRADIVIGIDAPDFNLGLELWLRERGVKTAHYVSPSVWAWRQGRIHKIQRAVDLMLTLFPFEEQFYRDHAVPVACVGHPLADQFPLRPDVATARAQLHIAVDKRVVALLPGSRGGEIAQVGAAFFDTAAWLRQRHPDLHFVLPAANAARRAQIEALLAARNDRLPIQILDGQSQLAMTAADVVLMTSGTTTLEALLLKKPMVVAYRMGAWSFALVKRLVKIQFMSLPNLLAGRELVPERLQDDVCAEVLGPLLLEQLDNQVVRAQLEREFQRIHEMLRRDASARAATALLQLLGEKTCGDTLQ
ncbi:MAG TPA: lipid-A-disaccharide synthase [Spongiibacteraceae bacterium]|nr:lipid-A-disaccharide synthase [Spongiibacteraceae bacterium]